MRVHAAVRNEPEQVHVAAAVARAPKRRDERHVLEEAAVRDRAVDPLEVLVEHAAGADRQMADLGVAHLPRRQTDRLARRSEPRVRVLAPQAGRKPACLASSTAFPGPGGAQPQPSRMTSATSGNVPAAANRGEAVDVEGRAADERAVDVGLGEQLVCVVGLHRAAVEHRQVEQRLDERVRVLRELRRRGRVRCRSPRRARRRARAARAGRSVADRVDLSPEHGLGVARLALFLRLADARDHASPARARPARGVATPVVGLAEVLAALRVADEQPATPSPSSIGADTSPVYAPSGSQWTFCAYVVGPRARRTPARAVNGGQTMTSTPPSAVERAAEAAVSAGPGEHLPVAGDQHQPRRDRRHAGKLLALEQLERRAAARRDPRDALGEPELVERAHRVGAADDRERRRSPRRPPRPPSSPRRSAATRRRPSGRSRRSSARRRSLARSARASRGPMSSPSQPSGTSSYGDDAGLGVLRERGGADDVDRQLDANVSGLSSRICSAILPPIEHRVRPPAEVLEHAELVLDLRAARDEDERALDVAEQLAEVLELRSSSRPGVGRQEVRDALGRGVRAVRGAECVVDVEVAAVASSRANAGSFFVSPGSKRVFSSTSPRSSGSSSREPRRDGRHRVFARSASAFGRPRCEQTRTSAAPRRAAARASAARRGCACRRRPGRPRAARSGRRGRARPCRRRRRRERSEAGAWLTDGDRHRRADLATRSTSRHE